MSQGTVLITGATGFTGGATVEQLLARGRHVRALAHREDARSKRLQELGAEVVFGDFLDLDAIRAAVQQRVSRSWYAAAATFRGNVADTDMCNLNLKE